MVSIDRLLSPAETEKGCSVPSPYAPVSLDHVASLLAGLNREQRRAVTHGEGPLLVLAGPGTGKTEVLTRRIAWLIATKRAQPRQILALTFTHKAALEMQQRVDLLVPYGQADTAIHTFHAFGDRVLREYSFELGLPGDLRLIGRAEAILLLREQIFTLGLDRYRPLAEPGRFLGALVDLFWRAKDEGILPEHLAAHARGLAAQVAAAREQDSAALLDLASAQTELARAYQGYQALLLQRGLIDHADQVLLALRLLRERPAIGRALQERYRYVLVDEFQDTNPAQLELLLVLPGERRNVSVVGDDDQAIYAFRGAAVSNLRRFVATHPGLRRVVLRRNYRSRAPIVEASQRLIRHNDPGRLATLDGLHSPPIAHRRRGSARPVRLQAFASRAEEADGVAAEIESRLSAGAAPSDFAVLVRTNGEVDAFVRSLAVKGVRARSSAPHALADRPEVRPLVSFLRVVADPASSQELYALATARPYSLGGEELTRLMALARRRHCSLWEVFNELSVRPELVELSPGTRRKLAGLVEDVRASIEMSHTSSAGEVLYDFLRRSGRLARLVRDSQAQDDPSALADMVRFFELVRSQGRLLNEDRVAVLAPHLTELVDGLLVEGEDGPDFDGAVSVLTVHRAKGLEFPVVFLCGLADGRFPVRGRPPGLALPAELLAREPATEPDELAEERRLCYVAMSRARDELVLSYALEGPGSRVARRPSPFVAEAMDVPATSLPAPDPVAPGLAPPAEVAPLPAPRASGAHEGALSLSFSQLEDYLGCPERYRLRHVVRVPTPPHHALAYGSALHQAVAAFHLRRAKGEVMSEDELLTAFAASWSPEGFLSRQHEEARYAAGQAALRRFRAAELAQGSLPAAIERPFSFSLGRDQLRGRVDRLDTTPDGTVITDYKSSDVRDQRKADQKARESLQLQVYALAHEAEAGELPTEVRLDFLDSGVLGRAVPDRARLDKTVARIEKAANDIRRARFEAAPSPIGCGYCPYRSICPSSAA